MVDLGHLESPDARPFRCGGLIETARLPVFPALLVGLAAWNIAIAVLALIAA